MELSVPLPPPVFPGDRVGVAALSGPVDPARLRTGLAALSELGFEPRLAANLSSRRGYLAGDDDERLDAFHELAADPSLAAIFFARGGYGALRVLDRIDWNLLAAHPRAYIGYSDLTPFLHEVVRRLGFAAFHGPMVAADMARGLGTEEREALLGALAGDLPRTFPVGGWLTEGTAEGPLLGGCLSLLSAVMATPFAPDLEGAILVLEDVGEPLYRLDRLLTQLGLAGVLERVAGVVLGHLDLPALEAAPESRPDEESREESAAESREVPAPPPALAALLADRLGGLSVPVGWGLPCGHSAPNLTLPLGVFARLDPSQGLQVGVS